MRRQRITRLETLAAKATPSTCPDCGRHVASINIRSWRQIVDADGTSRGWEPHPDRSRVSECPACAPRRQTMEVRFTRSVVRPAPPLEAA